MPFKHLRFLLAMCFTAVTLFQLHSQNQSITGRIIEKSTHEPMQFATIALFHENDTLNPFKGASSDSSGAFLITGVRPGKYYVTVSFLGYQNTRSPLFEHKEITHLKDIEIQASNILLEDITITGKREILTHEIDKKIYLVEKDLMSASGSAAEILQNIPSVSVDVDGNISLRGTSNILFLINSKPSAMLRRNPSVTLQQIPAATIARIEVITNPSAKYQPDGTGGIINIVLKKESRQGINGQVTLNAGNEERYGGDVVLNYGTEVFNTFANYSLRHSNRFSYYSDEQTIRDSAGAEVLGYFSEDGNSSGDALSHVVAAGAGYKINDNNNVELSGSWYFRNSMHDVVSEIATNDASLQPVIRLTSDRTNDEFEHEGEVAISWDHIFGDEEEHTFSFESTFAAFDEVEDQTYDEKQTFPSEVNNTETNLVEKSGNQTELTAEYSLPVSEDAELEAGYAGEFIHEDINYTNDFSPGRFLLDQHVHALYGLFGQAFGNFGVKAGLRIEQAFTWSHLKEPMDSLVNNDYFKPYPTLHLSYLLTENQEIGLSYSKRINRPDADELNPNPEYSDPRNAEAGNPNLKPEQIHSVELGYHIEGEKITLTPSLYYRYKYDAFTSIKTYTSDSVLLTTTQNLDNRQSTGLEVILSGNPLKNWDLNLNVNLFYEQIDAVSLGFTGKNSVVSADLKLYSLYYLTPATLFQFNLFYFSPRITPQGQRNQYFYANAGMKQQLFRKRAAITFTVSDVFHTFKVTREIDVPELYQTTSYHRKSAIFYLGFTWFFNTNNDNEKGLNFEDEGL